MSDINALSQAFKPLQGPNSSTIALSVVGTSHAATSLPTPPGGSTTTPDSAPKQFEIVNTSTTLTVSLAFGTAPAATIPTDGGAAGCYTIGPGQTRVISVDGNPTQVAAIGSGAGPTLVYITAGNGR